MKKEYEHLGEKAKKLAEKIRRLPEGKLVITKDQNSYKWFCSDGHTKQYIKKKDKEFAVALAKKKYLTCQLEETLHEKKSYSILSRSSYRRHSQINQINYRFRRVQEPFK